MTVLFFGQLAEMAGLKELSIEDTKDTAALRSLLLLRFPALAEVVFKLAVNTIIIDKDIPLQANSTIALLPPFSGG